MTGEDEARRWLAVAEEDLDFATYAERGEYHAHAYSSAQQAAEKAVKAVHYPGGARAVLGHSVRNLIERLDPRVAELDARLDDARALDLYYVPTRYPSGLDAWTPATGFGKPQAERALAASRWRRASSGAT